MLAPLTDFDWTTLHARYRTKCKRFNSVSECLRELIPLPLKNSEDLDLYYQLAGRFCLEKGSPSGISVATYKAMLYWKLYSIGMGVAEGHCREIAKNPTETEETLTEVCRFIPEQLSRSVNDVRNLVLALDKFPLRGMKSKCTFPVRTVFLHFVYPETVPIFDRMVLQAVGYTKEAAKKAIYKESVLLQYIEHIWSLEKRYLHLLPQNARETPLRLVEMALWVNR